MRNRGFTLIEMLVSVAIFTTVMVIALGALVALSEADRKAQTVNAAVNNLSFAIDSMSRLIRTGLDYHCGLSGTLAQGQNCVGSQPVLAFQVTNGALINGCAPDTPCTVLYCLSAEGSVSTCNTNTFCTAGSSCSILRSTDDGDSFSPITSPEIAISNLGFYVVGEAANDNVQPKVTMLVSGSVPVTATKSTVFNLQTSVTERLYGL